MHKILDIHILYSIGNLQHCPRQNYILVIPLSSMGLEGCQATWDGTYQPFSAFTSAQQGFVNLVFLFGNLTLLVDCRWLVMFIFIVLNNVQQNLPECVALSQMFHYQSALCYMNEINAPYQVTSVDVAARKISLPNNIMIWFSIYAISENYLSNLYPCFSGWSPMLNKVVSIHIQCTFKLDFASSWLKFRSTVH